jgi:hypothetical protein
MTELSNAVTVLIARMETHPEDFEIYGAHVAKFAGIAEALYKLCGDTNGKGESPLWFLNDADKQALRDAWAKDVMEKVFDERYYERQEEAKLYEQQMKQQMYQQRMAAQNQLAASTGTYQTTQIQPGQFHPLHNAQNAAQSSGFLGSIFGGSK